MTSSIPCGTLLRQRYLIQKVLGQGGFSRTYLALDRERFNEPCVLKELAVPHQDASLFEKSKALFQREAGVLYQLQHPQIPRFWAAFEDEQRLFSVQDFIDGQTYRSLLEERKRQGKKFLEQEVVEFLNHLLPVLSYIHERNIIHRDISLENIMLRMRDSKGWDATNPVSTLGLPILIDFGAVKAVESYLFSAYPAYSSSEVTRVGKPGYAPPEQLQTGKVYPHSDLYALAASCLVLLTGKEPKSLLDGRTLTWQWHEYATLSDRLGEILQKMLALRPGDRYHSAREVQADLQALVQDSPTPLGASNERPLISPLQQPPNLDINSVGQSPNLSPFHLPKTITHHSGGLPALLPKSGPLNAPTKKIRDYWLGIGIGALIIVLGFAMPTLWRAWNGAPQANNEVWVSGAKLPQSEVSQLIESQRKTDKELDSAQIQPQPIQFAPGEVAAVVQGNLQNQTLRAYTLRASQGQIMTVSLKGSGVMMNVLRSDEQGIDTAAYQTQSWTGQLPTTDDYLIQVLGFGVYTLEVAIAPQPKPTPAQAEAVNFASGSNSATITGRAGASETRRYRLKAKRGQVIAVRVLQGAVNLKMTTSKGQQLANKNGRSLDWQGRLPMDGDYIIEATATQPGAFTLSVDVF